MFQSETKCAPTPRIIIFKFEWHYQWPAKHFQLIVLQAFFFTLQSGVKVWLGPPCSWWVFLSSSVHGRSNAHPEGDTSHPWVRHHNLIAEFVASVIMTCTALGICYVLEQPISSTFHWYKAVKEALRITGAHAISIPLYKFGAPTTKFLHLFGTAPWLGRLKCIADNITTPRPCHTLCTIDTHGRTTGKKRELLDSAAYPHAFCQVVAMLHQSHMRQRFEITHHISLVCSSSRRQGPIEQEAVQAYLLPAPEDH